jgi:hypothetical protein
MNPRYCGDLGPLGLFLHGKNNNMVEMCWHTPGVTGHIQINVFETQFINGDIILGQFVLSTTYLRKV